MITLERFRLLDTILRARGYGDMIAWSEALAPPKDARAFAREAIYVIVNSGMKVTVANPIYWRCVRALNKGDSAAAVFRHPGKVYAIDHIWRNRRPLFDAYMAAHDKLAFCLSLPWCGRVTQYHLAKNLGEDVVKPDVHLVRLAKYHGCDPFELCGTLALHSGYRIGTVDTILWRACADGIIDSTVFANEGWEAAFRGDPDVSV